MKLAIKTFADMPNHFCVVRAEHDGREWWQPMGEDCQQFMMSERLSPEACIEGDTSQLLDIATAITLRQGIWFNRIAVEFVQGGVHIWSPKNSRVIPLISLEDADDLVEQIMQIELTNQ